MTNTKALGVLFWVFIAASCSTPSDSNSTLSDFDIYINQIDEYMPDPCVAADDAVYFKVEDSWHLRPCSECLSRDVELFYGGNTGQHLDMEAALDEMMEELSIEEIPVSQYEQRAGFCE